jgi:hypothetical protein
VRRELTEAEKRRQEREPWRYTRPLYNSFPSGRLFLKIEHSCSGLRKHWSDGRRQRLEACLGAFVLQLEHVAAWIKTDRQRREDAEQKRRAWELKRAEKLRAIHEEEQRLATLRAQVDAWCQSERLRGFVRAVDEAARNGRIRHDAELRRWLAWVSDQADRLDPLSVSPPSILDEKKRYES